MAKKRKNITLAQQYEWLTNYLEDDKNFCKKQLLLIIKNDINRNMWSDLPNDTYQYLKSILNEETTARAKRIFIKYLGDPLPDGFHGIGIWYMSQFQEIIEEFDEELRCEPYGYLSEYGAFCNDRAPAYIFMHKYHEKYVVWICDEMTNGSGSDYIPECNIFDTKGEADSYFDSLVGEGIKDGEEQIEECLKNVTEPNKIIIRPESSGIYYNVDFRVYYQHQLIIEHMSTLSSEAINNAIAQYKNYCRENQIEIINIYKMRPWNSNQRYYVIEYYDRKSNENHYMNIHIPSKMQGRQRTVIELIKSNNIVENML